MSKITEAQTLPSKEANLFKKLLKFYDQKHYKKGLNIANLILANPCCNQHGETLAFKGMMLFCVGKKSEGRELVKKGVMLNLRSYVCWHVYGSLHKLEKNYVEAIKCFTQALRLGPENVQVYRELCSLQMQTRNFEACKETRAKCISNKISPKSACLGYIVAQHLTGNFDSALSFLDEYLKVIYGTNPSDYETSELFLYKAFIYMEAKKYDQAYEFLKLKEKSILDKSSLLEFKSECLINLGRMEEAENLIHVLLTRNSECENYIKLYCRCHGINISNEYYPKETLPLLKEIQSKYPKSKYLGRVILGLYEKDEFLLQIDKYLRSAFIKGIPPLFVQVEYLYEDASKVETIQNLIEQYAENIEKYKTLGPIKGIKEEDNQFIEPPTTGLWLNYFRAQHYKKLKNYKKALNIVHEELIKTPTVVDFYNFVSDCLRESGDQIGASRWSEEAQSLDTADRFINSLCVKSLLRANRISDAETMAFKFTFGSKSSVDYLTDMQCIWFLSERAKAFHERNDLGQALKMCHLGDRSYSSNYDDQMDFHSYCIRKVTLRSYVECLRLCDNIRSHAPYYDIAFTAIKIYLHLYKNPGGIDKSDTDAKQELTAQDKKRRAKEKKAAFRAKEEAERIKSEAEKLNRNKHNHENQTSTQEEDPTLLPENLIKIEKPLEEAKRFLAPLVVNFGDKIETHCLAYEVYERVNKIGLMFNSIAMAYQLPAAASHPWLHECIIRFLIYSQSLRKNLPSLNYEDDEAREIHSTYHRILFERIDTFFKSLPSQQTDPTSFNDHTAKKHSNNFVMSFACQLSKAFINPKEESNIFSQLPKLSSKNWTEGIAWSDAYYVYNRMIESQDHYPIGTIDQEIIEEMRTSCKAKYPLASVFYTEEEKQKLRDYVIDQVRKTKDIGLYSRLLIGDKNNTASLPSTGNTDKFINNTTFTDDNTCGRIHEWIAKLNISIY